MAITSTTICDTKERFATITKSINLSRSTIESIVLSDNCRCNLSIYDSKRCFTLNIGDVYSGNLNIKGNYKCGIVSKDDFIPLMRTNLILEMIISNLLS